MRKRRKRRFIPNPVISNEAAFLYGLKIESLDEYANRLSYSRSGARDRILSGNCYGFKVSGKWFIATRNGRDITWVHNV